MSLPRRPLAYAVLLCMLLLSLSHAGTLTLAWNASTSADVTGYRVLYGTVSSSYPMTLDAGNFLTVTVAGLDPAAAHYFVATAYAADGRESPYSTPELVVPPTAADPTPVVRITAPTNGATVPRRGRVAVTVTVDIAVSSVQVFVNGASLCVTASPYTCVWTVPPAAKKTYQLQALATTSTGKVGWSSIVTVHTQ